MLGPGLLSGPTRDTGVLVGAVVIVGGIGVFVAVERIIAVGGIRVLVGTGVSVHTSACVVVAEGINWVGAEMVASTSKIAVKVKFGVGVKNGVGADMPGKLHAIEINTISITGKLSRVFLLRILASPLIMILP